MPRSLRRSPKLSPVRIRRDQVASAVDRSAAVLVLESDPESQSSLARTLTAQGNRVIGTASAEGAFALVRAFPVDVALLGQPLPGSTALDVARRLRSLRPGIRVVLMTDAQTRELQIAARLAGVVALITRPFRPEVMAEVLAGLMPPALHFAR